MDLSKLLAGLRAAWHTFAQDAAKHVGDRFHFYYSVLVAFGSIVLGTMAFRSAAGVIAMSFVSAVLLVLGVQIWLPIVLRFCQWILSSVSQGSIKPWALFAGTAALFATGCIKFGDLLASGLIEDVTKFDASYFPSAQKLLAGLCAYTIYLLIPSFILTLIYLLEIVRRSESRGATFSDLADGLAGFFLFLTLMMMATLSFKAEVSADYIEDVVGIWSFTSNGTRCGNLPADASIRPIDLDTVILRQAHAYSKKQCLPQQPSP